LVLLAWVLLAGALLLLAGLRLPAALLAGLLTRVLVLLARIRILTAHSEFSFLLRTQLEITSQHGIGCKGTAVPPARLRGDSVS